MADASMQAEAPQTAEEATQTSPTVHLEHKGPHSPLPIEFHHAPHHHAHHEHKKPPGVREDDTPSSLEAAVVIKTQEIHSLREESNRLEAKLLHNQEVLQIKEHELGVLEGRLMEDQDFAAKHKEAVPHPDFVATMGS